MVLHDAGLDEVALDPFDTAVRPLFIDLHEAAVAGDIAGNNRSKTARRRLSRRIATSARFQFANFTHDLGLHTPHWAVSGADITVRRNFQFAKNRLSHRRVGTSQLKPCAGT